MNGEDEFSTTSLAAKIALLDKMCSDYQIKVGLGALQRKEHEECEYLGWDADQIRSLTGEQAIEASLNLCLYKGYLQNILNYIRTRVKFCDYELSKMYGKYSEDFGGYMYEDKKNRVNVNNDYAARLIEFKNQAESHLTSLEYLPGFINDLSERFRDVYYARTKYREKD